MSTKLLLIMFMLSTYLFASINVQTASKAELMSISGIGAKKADSIMKYRKSHTLKSANDLLKVKGIGKGIVANVKGNIKNKAKSTTKKKSTSKVKSSSKTKSKKRVMKKKKVTKKKTSKVSKKKVKKSKKKSKTK